ncbi:hypothetical protein BHE74_00016103 [Ensete ventricosum]|nr:hypothetical protein GW17_00051998 [Ensete ventricosum]RWW75842.1 hypothetical protein BHE74_00016103 [Ensete ventricosum]RZR95476.1 hypothetical protein BHM03_00024333 [Ensete ventricosum]
MAKHHGDSSKMGQAGPLPKQPQVGCKCKLASKLLEPLMRSAAANKTSVKLRTRRAEEMQSGALTGKRSHKERLKTVETRLDFLEASLEELYQRQGRILGVESSQKKLNLGSTGSTPWSTD